MAEVENGAWLGRCVEKIAYLSSVVIFDGMKKIVNPYKELDGYNCFGCAPHNKAGVRMEFYEDGDEVVSFWQPEPQFQGWLNTLHGGVQAVLLDEISAWVVMRKLQTTGVTSKMEIRFLRPVSTAGGKLTLRARLAGQMRNVATIEASLLDDAGTLCSKATCVYFTFPREKAEKEMHFRACELED